MLKDVLKSLPSVTLCVAILSSCSGSAAPPTSKDPFRTVAWEFTLDGGKRGTLVIVGSEEAYNGTLELEGEIFSLGYLNLSGTLESGDFSYEDPRIGLSGSFSSTELRASLTASEGRFEILAQRLELAVWVCGNHRTKHAAITEEQRKELTRKEGCEDWSPE